MKNLKNLKQIAVISMLILLGGCSSDNSLNINNTAIDSEIGIQSKSLEPEDACTTAIIIDYSGLPMPIGVDLLSYKENFEIEMSQYFTICAVYESKNCPRIDKWIVNGAEYFEYIHGPNGGQTAGTGNSSNGGPRIKPEAAYENDEVCVFRTNFPIFN